MMKMPAGNIPDEAQNGLNRVLRQQGFFLACQFYPAENVEVMLDAPESSFCYLGLDKNCHLVLMVAGTGVAALYKIAKTAVLEKHQGQISLYHGINSKYDLCMVEELEKLASEHNNFDYVTCFLNENFAGRIISGLGENKKNIIVYLCGTPGIIEELREKIFLSGVSPVNIYADIS